jgi:acyl-coenzyme A thioesterase PaaI-like protein
MKPESARSRFYRIVLNIWPCIRGTGVRITYLSGDFQLLKAKLPLNWRTRNRVGTIFGGSLYASTDPFFMLMLMEILGKDFVVWDKGANIRFKRPGKETLYFEMSLTPEQITAIREKAIADGEYTFDLPVELKNKAGVVHAEVSKTLYVARKEFYQQKMKKKAAADAV